MTIDTRAPLHSVHVAAALGLLESGRTMKGIKEDLHNYSKPLEGHNWQKVCGFWVDVLAARTKADFRDQLVNLHNALKQREAMPATPAPEITPAQRQEHLEHADALRGILMSHGIDAQDWDACLDYLLSSELKYMVKIYVDYIHGIAPEPTKLIVNSQQAEMLRAAGYGGDLSVVDTLPPLGRAMRVNMSDRDVVTLAADNPVYPALSVPPLGYLQMMGRALRAPAVEWHHITDQEARATYTSACNFAHSKSNRLPRGKCALRMLNLGWEFNHG